MTKHTSLGIILSKEEGDYGNDGSLQMKWSVNMTPLFVDDEAGCIISLNVLLLTRFFWWDGDITTLFSSR